MRGYGEGEGGGLRLNNSINSAGHVYYIYVMVTNASCAIVIEDQADQVGSANDFTCNGVPKKRKASAITDFFCKRPTGHGCFEMDITLLIRIRILRYNSYLGPIGAH